MAFVSGSFARSLQAVGEEDVVLQALASLREMFGSKSVPEERTAALQMVAAHRVTRWTADPFARGSYSYIPVSGLPGDYDALAKTYFNGALQFAGEATCRKYPGTVHGALLSGERAAKVASGVLAGRA